MLEITEEEKAYRKEHLAWKDAPLHAGDIVWVDMDQLNDRGALRKMRPAIVFQNEFTSKMSEVIMIMPITSSPKQIANPFAPNITAELTGSSIEGAIRVNQIQTVDKRLVVEREVRGLDYDYVSTLFPDILRSLKGFIDPTQYHDEDFE